MNHSIALVQFEYAWEVQAYLRFCRLNFEEHNAEYPSVDLTGELPQLCVDGVFLGKNKIIPYLKEHVQNLDSDFSPEIQNEITTYTYMIHQYGNPAYNCYKWTDSKQVKEYLSPIYSSILSFPYNHIYRRMQQKKYNKLMGVTLDSDGIERMINNLYRILNEKLHNTPTVVQDNQCQFLFGSTPSSLDAALFGHLAQVMEFPAGMQSILLCYPRLVSYYETIMNHYFSAARGEQTSDNPFIKQLGFHISCQPTEKIDSILPYKDTTPRPFDNLDLNEENQKVVMEDPKPTAEEQLHFREQFVYYAGFGAIIFALAVMIDLF